MDLAADLGLLPPAVLFTLLALIIGALVLRAAGPCGSSRPQGALSHGTQELFSGKGTESTAHTAEDLKDDLCKLPQTEIASKCETPVSDNDESTNIPSVNMGQEDKPLRYMPGMLRTSQLEKMMSKEELEEERRVQREQLTAIFKLLKENQDAFGEVTEHDMEEQLKLYSI